ncbi:MAG: ABC transporter ATP-binding protein [Clostridia bacterium]|nr:ABC transporter ATP-binding protein [Clostridia bacterium]
MRKLVRFLKGYKKQVFFGPLFKLAEAVLELIVPLVMVRIIDIGIANQDKLYVLRMGGLLLLIAAVSLSCALVCQYFASIASQGVGTDIRNSLFQKINRFSHRELDKFGTPSLITRLTGDVNQLQLAVAMLIRLVIRAPFLAVGSVVMAMFIDLKLSVVFMIVMPLIAFVLYLIMSRSIPFFRTIQRKLDRISLIVRENLEGARVIRAFSKQQHEAARFSGASDELTQTAVGVGRLSALLNPLTYAIMNFAIIVIIWCGGLQVNTGALTQGEIIAFINYMTQVLLALVVVANLVVTFTKASASASRVNEIFETEVSVADTAATPVFISPAPNMPLLEFKQVSFSYHDNEEYALQDVSLQIYAGETIGIIGGTGSGKSTLVQLIPRFYDVSKGELLLHGVPLQSYPLSQLRAMIGMAPQKASVVSGTIAANLRWGDQSADDNALWDALRTAQAAEFVQSKPGGLQAEIRQGGQNLSGGQKQRLTIARALVGKPDILILDDSSSALDYATDAALRQAIRRDIVGATVFLVSQRVSSIRHADKIVVLDDGCVAGVGKHDDLLRTCEVYREICLSQLSAQEVECHE